jgi:pyruvate formate lyase activating enzyme
MIADLHPCSFIDFPGELTAVLFTKGCNLRCRYCHNPALCSSNGGARLSLEEVAHFFASRKGKLTAVTVTGGEPTLHAALPDLLSTARTYGFKVKLDTNGMRPRVVRELIREGLVDYAAVDVKVAPGVDASWLTGAPTQGERAIETLSILAANNLSCEARTTVVGGIHDTVHLAHMTRYLAAAGVKSWRLQPAQTGSVLDTTVRLVAPGETLLAQTVEQAKALGMDAAVRPGANSKSGVALGISASSGVSLFDIHNCCAR